MSLCDLSKTLSSEIENLFAQLGDSSLPEEAHRLPSERQSPEDVELNAIIQRVGQANTKSN